MWSCIVTNFFIIIPTRYTNFTNLFWNETLHVSSRTRIELQFHPGPARKLSTNPAWHIPLLSVQRINSWWWTEELSETCRVSCQNKFVKLVILFGFIIKEKAQFNSIPTRMRMWTYGILRVYSANRLCVCVCVYACVCFKDSIW
jgi:hypothetical protein